MLERFRGAWAAIMAPPARLLNSLGVSPDVVTIIGTLGVLIGALVCFPQGWLWQGVLVVTAFVFADMLDGQMAKSSGKASNWGAFLDSSLDRLGDAAVFGGILLYFTGPRDSLLWSSFALAALALGQVTSYVKARAESLGFTCSGGLAARADRLLLILLGAFLAGVGVPYVLEAVLVVLSVFGAITVAQRVVQVRRQARAAQTSVA
jgi:CDP-diacylglycerol--glycerol-3-phosphate 3-phosphatidyltransferase